ncbi:MAG: protein-L-isoaspartate(D-aspartate) O-methyltransferase [Gammaproteobacteria bacterium]|nr:protein-L-isoaspartate(D-aspartate) O-methyltransferase [Gammaproteobacteria bacterium]
MVNLNTKTQHMLEVIESEVEYTRSMIGRDSLSPQVMKAMSNVPRDKFVPDDLKIVAFDNGPLPIGHGQTISQPYIVALMTDLLDLKPEHIVLEVGTGSGYQTAILSQLCQQVYSLEVIAPLSEAAALRLKELGYHNIEVRVGNGYQGWPEHAPYDAIIVTAAAAYIPEALKEQLKPGGKMVIPVGLPHMYQELMLLEKDLQGDIKITTILGVAFVPLVDIPDNEHPDQG